MPRCGLYLLVEREGLFRENVVKLEVEVGSRDLVERLCPSKTTVSHPLHDRLE